MTAFGKLVSLGFDEHEAECFRDGWEFVVVSDEVRKSVYVDALEFSGVCYRYDIDGLYYEIEDAVVDAAEKAGIGYETLDTEVLWETCIDLACEISHEFHRLRRRIGADGGNR
jgi:hypothetical protein